MNDTSVDIRDYGSAFLLCLLLTSCPRLCVCMYMDLGLDLALEGSVIGVTMLKAEPSTESPMSEDTPCSVKPRTIVESNVGSCAKVGGPSD